MRTFYCFAEVAGAHSCWWIVALSIRRSCRDTVFRACVASASNVLAKYWTVSTWAMYWPRQLRRCVRGVGFWSSVGLCTCNLYVRCWNGAQAPSAAITAYRLMTSSFSHSVDICPHQESRASAHTAPCPNAGWTQTQAKKWRLKSLIWKRWRMTLRPFIRWAAAGFLQPPNF
jgi:hypothetical protein